MRFRLLAAIGVLFPASLGAADLSEIAPEIVSLPEFRVYTTLELPKAEEWHYARVGGFEFLSNASSGNTRRFIRDFHGFQNMLAIVSPIAVVRAELPVTIILCGKDDQFARITPPELRRMSGTIGSALLRDEEIAAIVLDFQRRAINRDTPEEIEFEPTDAFYREYVKLAMMRLDPQPPAWFSEGVARIISKTRITNAWIDYANLEPFLEPGADSLVRARVSYSSGISSGAFRSPSMSAADMTGRSLSAFGPSSTGSSLMSGNAGSTVTYVPIPLMPLERFFALTSAAAQRGVDPDTQFAGTWPKQAMLFVHLGLYGENKKYQKPFLQFLERAMRAPVTEQMFQECFGLSFREMDKRLKDYLSFSRYQHYVLKANKGESFTRTPPFELRRATDAEVGRIKGEALRLGGDPTGAQREFVTAYLRGERDPALLASLGLLARQREDDARALTYLKQIASVTIPRPRAYLELARLRYEALQRDPSSKRKLSPAEAANVLEPLFVARTLQPPLSQTYLQIAEVWENSSTVPTLAHLSVLREGANLFPGHITLLKRTAELHAKHGFTTDAEELNRIAAAVQLRPRFAAAAPAETAPDNALSAATPSINRLTTSPAAVLAPQSLKPRAPFTGPYSEMSEVDRKPREKKPLHLVRAPSVVNGAAPEQVIISFVVTPEGRATQAHVRSDASPEIGAAAIKAIEETVFAPGVKAGKPVATAVTRVVTVTPET